MLHDFPTKHAGECTTKAKMTLNYSVAITFKNVPSVITTEHSNILLYSGCPSFIKAETAASELIKHIKWPVNYR